MANSNRYIASMEEALITRLEEIWKGLQESEPDPKSCLEYQQFFGRLSVAMKGAGDHDSANAAKLLEGVSSLMFKPEAVGNPWRSLYVDYRQGRRSIEADDLSEEHLNALADFLGLIQEPELKSRIADVLWTRNRGFNFGLVAIENYHSEEPRSPDADSWPDRIWRAQRAATIARKLGKEKPVHLVAFQRLESLAEALAGDFEIAIFLPSLMEFIFDHRLGDAEKYITLAESFGGEFASLKDWTISIRFWEIASQWHHRKGDEDAARRCRLAAGHVMVSRGRDAEGRRRHGIGYSAAWLLRGVTALKNSGGEKDEIADLSAELVDLQKQARVELQTYTFDPRESVEDYEEALSKQVMVVRDRLQCLSLEEAVAVYCGLGAPTDVQNLRSTILGGEAGILSRTVQMVATDEEGKVVDSAEGMNLLGDPNEEAFRKRMFEQARVTIWPLACEWFVDPGRRVILENFAPRPRDLAFLVHSNPFIPLGREGMYLRGLHAGFEGDFLLATHLLVPQFENSLRVYLKGAGALTWINKGGLQMEMDLGGMLSLPQAAESFGEDLLFDLRGLLTEKFGENLRNDMAHGKMGEAAFFQRSGPVYFWWLLLRMLWIAFDQATTHGGGIAGH